jgi:hypothetical protein
MEKTNVAIDGLGFGAEFIPLWQNHPHANCYAIRQLDVCRPVRRPIRVVRRRDSQIASIHSLISKQTNKQPSSHIPK